jgi:hypothetical protein
VPKQVDAIGTARRLQALAAIGWHTPTLARRIGWSERSLVQIRVGSSALGSDARFVVSREKDAQLRQLYPQLARQAPERPDGRALRLARINGWAGPEHWASNEEMDDRNAVSDLAYRRTERDERAPLRFEDVEFLSSSWGGSLSDEAIAAHFRVSLDAVQKARARARYVSTSLLSDDQVLEIRDRYPDVAARRLTHTEIAETYGVHRTVIARAMRGHMRPHLELTDLTARPLNPVGHLPTGSRAATPGGQNEEERRVA